MKIRVHDPIEDPELYQKMWENIIYPGQNELMYPGRFVVNEPGFSVNYCDCNGVAIVGRSNIGLSHFLLSDELPEDYIPALAADVAAVDGSSPLVAAVIAGDPNHFSRITGVLRKLNIRIVGEYQDGWVERDPEYGKRGLDYKAVMVDPKQRDVIVWSARNGYKELIPN